MSELVDVALEGSVLSVTMARPDKKNAITNAMYGAMADALERAEGDTAIRAVLIQGDGDSFTAGNDLADFAAVSQGARGERHVTRFLKSLAVASRPLVAAVQGNAVGIGTTMLLHCDLVYLASNARLITPFVNLALVPEAASTWLMPQRIGHARAYAMFALGEPVEAETAVSIGLANAVVPPDALRARARAAAEALAKRPLGSLQHTKLLMRDTARISAQMAREGEIFQERLMSAEAREAFAAFAERRQPDFSKVAG
ncbi:enoyl-CoA hydratase/isomerase family protein [Bradyrhizobium jicamae]|uniref:Enoyl-CoA hydratase/isomerase family protein n=1 Tax=Bradyrhizobium jicamae TaxID=280332 RepID=A0ABS5FG03_9BRAD|nr:enoyl-CoA hydratase-related protein [Bradyrhizobium jicamae]MBR0795722.1 enoyl-CoA hydratase/isomerase family protein [Bradyrhizobium jicamae]